MTEAEAKVCNVTILAARKRQSLSQSALHPLALLHESLSVEGGERREESGEREREREREREGTTEGERKGGKGGRKGEGGAERKGGRGREGEGKGLGCVGE
jgi:hypothetical protein